MRVVVATEPGTVELNWLWLPTVIGMNTKLKEDLEKKLAARIEGLPLTADSMDHVHAIVVDVLCEEFSHVMGLKEYLQAIQHVHFDATF